MKICTKCKEVKSVDNFHKRGSNYRSDCKSCRSNSGVIHRTNNREKVNADKRNNYYKHQESILLNKKAKYKEKPEHYINISRNYYLENTKERREYAKTYRQVHESEIKTYQDKYRPENKEAIALAQYKWEKNKLDTSPGYRITKNLRNRLRNAVKRIKGVKLSSAILDLPKDDKDLMSILEATWSEGMSWDNYGSGEGKWNIDHHIPFAYFTEEEMTIEENQRIINHPLNLRAMWSSDNFSKFDSVPDDVDAVLEQIKKAIKSE